jgi:hypothetical protein
VGSSTAGLRSWISCKNFDVLLSFSSSADIWSSTLNLASVTEMEGVARWVVVGEEDDEDEDRSVAAAAAVELLQLLPMEVIFLHILFFRLRLKCQESRVIAPAARNISDWLNGRLSDSIQVCQISSKIFLIAFVFSSAFFDPALLEAGNCS